MISKCDQLRAAWAVGDKISALRIAARFFDRSDDTKTFKRGMDAFPAAWKRPRPIDRGGTGKLGTKCALPVGEDEEKAGR
jgi:hypothetical protein